MAKSINKSISKKSQPQHQVVELKRKENHMYVCACKKHFWKLSALRCHVQNYATGKLVKGNWTSVSEQNLSEEDEVSAPKVLKQNPKSDNQEGMSPASSLSGGILASAAPKRALRSSFLENSDNPTDTPE
ncbi:unnamed protein product [Orchesella dallaii]|uniref:C2H2-type domain-containing protein n=1 Tax=Orchesella dallaii TaxID=48710 RepID=A0ABP1RMW5_9HEXA